MKKTYTTPSIKIVELSAETSILSGSGGRDQFDVGMSNDAMKGSEALSCKKNMWGREGIWE